MLVDANVPMKYCFHPYREAFKTATDLDGLVMVTVNGKRDTNTCLVVIHCGRSI